MTFHLDTVLSLMAAIPAGIALAQSKDGATRAWCGALLLVSLMIGARYWIAPLNNALNANILNGLAIAAVALAIVSAVRAGNIMLATLMVSGTALIALLALGIVQA